MKKLKDSQFIRIITKIKNKLFENKKEIGFFLCLVVVGIFFVVHSVEAQPTISDIKSGIIDAFSDFLNLLNKVVVEGINFLFEFFLKLAKYNSYIDTNIVKVGWILVRDVANMFFVVIMLVIAFGTILGLENYQWNKLLGKLIFAAIFINFSNMICGLIIDIAYVFSLTFLNAIVNTAGANLINTVHMDKLNNFDPSTEVENSTMILVSNFVALMFSIILLLTIGAFAIIMLLRMVMLWILIILSPLAFIMQVMPQTQEYAKQWWGKFTKQVLVLPVMVFFLWLTLSTMSGGTIADDLGVGMGGSLFESENSTIAQITRFDNLANFFVPIAMLVTALTMVGQMGVVGGGLAGKALDFGKKVATIATGYALGRKLVGGAASVAKKAGKAAAWYAPVIGGEKWVDRGKTVWSNVKASYYRKASGLTSKGIVAAGELAEKSAQLEANKSRSSVLDSQEEQFKKDLAEAKTPEDKDRISKSLEEIKAEKQRLSGDRPKLEQEVQEQQKIVDEEFNKGGGALGWIARQGISTKKHLKKSEKQAEVMEQLAFKRMASDAGGVVFNKSIKDQDRLERGLLEAEEARTKAKDDEFVSKGRAAGLADKRSKFTKRGRIDEESREGLQMAEQIAGHKRRATAWQNKQKTIEQGIELKIDVKAKALTEGVLAEQIKLDESIKSDELKRLEAEEQAKVAARDKIQTGLDEEFKPQIDAAKAAIDQTETAKAATKAQEDFDKYHASDEATQEREREEAEEKEGREGWRTQINKERNELETDKEVFTRDVLMGIEQTEKEIKKATEYRRSLEEDTRGFINTPEDQLNDDQKEWIEELNVAKEKEKELIKKKKGLEDRKGTEEKVLFKKEEEVGLKENMTQREYQLYQAVQAAEKVRDDDGSEGGYKAKKQELEKVIKQKNDRLSEADKPVEAARQILSDYRTSKGKYEGRGLKEYEATPAFAEKKATVEAKKQELEEGLRKELGIGGFIAEQQAVAAETAAKAAKENMQGEALGLFGLNKMAESIAISEQFAAAGQKLKESIKQTHLGEIFKKGAKELETAITRAQKGFKDAYKDLGPAARLIKTEVENQYLTDRATAEKTHATDLMDSAYSQERFGFGTPNTAFKNYVKKRMDNTFQGVEREQAVTMALGSLQKLMSAKDRGEELTIDQRAQMQANVAYLTKQAWSDDLLAKIVTTINNRSKMHGEQRSEAEALKKIFVDRLGWAHKGKGDDAVIASNISSNVRTNDLHRLASYGGDVDTLQSENAVLRFQEKKGEGTGYIEAARGLSEAVKEAIESSGGKEVDFNALAQKLGLNHSTAGEELKTFARKFGLATSTIGEAVNKFKDQISFYSEANEMMADFKNFAVFNGHLDDGGHTYYDMDAKMARGQLAHQAYRFTLADWVKVDGGARLSKLKVHSIAKMDEDGSGTASYFDPKAFAATFQGATSKIMLQRLDVRNQKQIIKYGWDEAIRKDDDGRLIIGDKDSELVKSRFKGDSAAAMKDIARDFAVALKSSPEAFLALLGQNSGVGYEEAIRGVVNIKIGDQTFEGKNGLQDLLGWISSQIGDESQWNEDNNEVFLDEHRSYNDFKINIQSLLKTLNKNAQVSAQKAVKGVFDKAAKTIAEAVKESEREADEFESL